MKKRGFTLVEIMIVVAIIGILVAIAVPGFLKAREKSQLNACLESQEKMEGAVDNWALDEGKTTGAQAGYSDLVGFDKYLKDTPVCPVGVDPTPGPTAIGIPAVGTAASCPSDASATHVSPTIGT